MYPPDNMTCHETGHKKKCKALHANCWKWIQVQGQDSNTGEQINEWRCSDNWLVSLTIENSKLVNEVIAATNSFRNEVVNQNNAMLALANGGEVKFVGDT